MRDRGHLPQFDGRTFLTDAGLETTLIFDDDLELRDRLRPREPRMTVLGGCCGTDHRHVGAIARACAARP